MKLFHLSNQLHKLLVAYEILLETGAYVAAVEVQIQIDAIRLLIESN